jgi:hypothetical protein
VRSDDEQLLADARELVLRGWCRTVLACDDAGRQVEPWSSGARAWSPLGALLASWYWNPVGGHESFRIAYTSLAIATGGRLEEWNGAPWRTKQHVLNAFGRARSYTPGLRRRLLHETELRQSTAA